MSSISKAYELAEAGKEAMTSFDVMVQAANIVKNANTLSEQELIDLMFKYSGTLTAAVASRVTNVLMSESDFDSMCADIQMFDEIEKDVLGE
jgi:hypothetical protein